MKKWICLLLAVCLTLSLAACSAAPAAGPAAETVRAPLTPLDQARILLDQGDAAGAEALLRTLDLRDPQVLTLLDRAEEALFRSIAVDWTLATFGDLPRDTQVHSVRLGRSAEGTVRCTVDYTAPEGLTMTLISTGLSCKIPLSTTGGRDRLVFQLTPEDYSALADTAISLVFSRENQNIHYLTISRKAEASALPVSSGNEDPRFTPAVQKTNTLEESHGTIHSVLMEDLGEEYEICLDYTMPRGMTLWAQLVTNTSFRKQELWFHPETTTGEAQSHTFRIQKDLLTGWDTLELVFGSEQGYYIAAIELPLRVLITGGVPVGEERPLGYSIENELKTGSYEIHSLTAQPLSNGCTRYRVDMTLGDGMSADVFLQRRSGNTAVLRDYSNDPRRVLVFDLSPETMESVNYISVNAGASDSDRFFLNIMDNPVDPDRKTQGVPTNLPVNITEKGADGARILNCTVQPLADGGYRYSLSAQVPWETLCYVFDAPNGRTVSRFFGPTLGRDTASITFDLSTEEAEKCPMFTFSTNPYGTGGTVAVIDNVISSGNVPAQTDPVITPQILWPIRESVALESPIDSINQQNAGTVQRMQNTQMLSLGEADLSRITPLTVTRTPETVRDKAGVTAYGEYWFSPFPQDADLTQNPALAYSLSFADNTRFPDTMPGTFDPEALLQWGKDPGLQVSLLHELGYTGKGAVIAYIDQPTESHEAWNGENIHYANNANTTASMHGPAVLSLLCGTEIGTAPDAEVWFYGHNAWDRDQRTHAECLYQIIEQNKLLPEGDKITMVGFSDNIDPAEKNEPAFREAVAACRASGVMVFFCGEYGAASFLPMTDKNNPENLVPQSWSTQADLVYVPAAGRTTAATENGAKYIYWGQGGLSWTMPYVLGLYAIANEIDPSLTEADLKGLLVNTAWEVNGMRLINPVEFVAAALNGAGRQQEAADLRTAGENSRRYTYAVMNRSAMTEQDLASVESYLKTIADSTVLVVDASGISSAQDLYALLQADNATRGGTVAGVQLFGDSSLLPAFEVGYKVLMENGETDSMGTLLTDLFYGNFRNNPELLNATYSVMDHFENDLPVTLVPQWKVARLPLTGGEFAPFLEKYMAFVRDGGLKRQEIVNFSNPIFASSRHTDDMGQFLIRCDRELGILEIPYRLYGNLLGRYPVETEVLGGFETEYLTAENAGGIREFILNTHGQQNNLDKCWFEGGQEKRESLMNSGNINQVLNGYPYYLDLWTCNNGLGMKDNLATAALRGQAVGVFAATHLISNNGTNNAATLEAMTEGNFYWFYLNYLKALSEGASRSDAFFAAQRAYGNALLVQSTKPVTGEGNYQFNLCNLLDYHNFGLLEPSPAYQSWRAQ